MLKQSFLRNWNISTIFIASVLEGNCLSKFTEQLSQVLSTADVYSAKGGSHGLLASWNGKYFLTIKSTTACVSMRSKSHPWERTSMAKIYRVHLWSWNTLFGQVACFLTYALEKFFKKCQGDWCIKTMSQSKQGWHSFNSFPARSLSP